MPAVTFIPPDFFATREEWVLWLLAAGAIVLLAVGADRAVTAAVRLAAVLGMSKVIIGATVVSLGTTTPECFTSVTAALSGNPGLALGNGIGSIICDTALIFGLCACIQRLPLDRFILNRHGWLQLGSGALLVVLVFALAVHALGIGGLLGVLRGARIEGVVIPRWAGAGLLVLLAGYLFLSVRWARQHPQVALAEVNAVAKVARAGEGALARALGNLLLLAFGLALVIAGSNVMVGSSVELCRRYGVPESVLAATLVAFGTSLPELVTALASVIKRHPELMIGNIIGADILNVLFVVGASAAAEPLAVDRATLVLLLPVMLLVLVLMQLFILLSGRRFRRWQGALLLGIYVAYVAALVRWGASL